MMCDCDGEIIECLNLYNINMAKLLLKKFRSDAKKLRDKKNAPLKCSLRMQ